jgi:hypothetical protein
MSMDPKSEGLDTTHVVGSLVTALVATAVLVLMNLALDWTSGVPLAVMAVLSFPVVFALNLWLGPRRNDR